MDIAPRMSNAMQSKSALLRLPSGMVTLTDNVQRRAALALTGLATRCAKNKLRLETLQLVLDGSKLSCKGAARGG